MTSLWPNLRRLLPDALVMIHAALTLVLAGLGFVLAMPGDTFAGTAAFRHMAQIAPENAWAMAFWLTANIGLVGLLTPNKSVRLVSVMVIATMHAAFALEIFLSSHIATGTVAYSVYALLGYYLLLRRVLH